MASFVGIRIIGRPMPAPESMRRLAAALIGRPMPVQLADLVTRGATMRDGTARPMDARAYADPDLEAVRAAVTDAELVQVIGRGRGINRTAANPLDVWVLAGDVLLPLPLNSLTTWQDAAPGPFERMAARGGPYQRRRRRLILSQPQPSADAYGAAARAAFLFGLRPPADGEEVRGEDGQINREPGLA